MKSDNRCRPYVRRWTYLGQAYSGYESEWMLAQGGYFVGTVKVAQAPYDTFS